MSSENEEKASDFLSKAILHHRSDGTPVWDVKYLLSKPELHIETDSEKVVCCPFLKRDVLLKLERFQEFSSFSLSDFTSDGVMLSYKWESKGNPDSSGKTLKFVKDVLRANPKIQGCFIDYLCLPQEPRSASQQAVFNTCLRSMNVWYTSYPVISCRLDVKYFESSWCLCENMLASHSQDIIAVAGMMDPEALIIKFIGNQILQKYLMSTTAILKVCEQFHYRPNGADREMDMNVFAQSVLASVMLRIAKSHATNGYDKVFIIEIMRAFTQVTLMFVCDVFPVRGIIEDVRFENTLDVIGILDDGSEIHFSENTTNPRDTLMGCTVVRKDRIKKDIDYLFN